MWLFPHMTKVTCLHSHNFMKQYKPRCHAKGKTPIVTRNRKPRNAIDAFRLLYFKHNDLWLNYIEDVLYNKNYSNISRDCRTFSFVVDDIEDPSMITETVRILKKHHPDFDPYTTPLTDYLKHLPMGIRNKVSSALWANQLKNSLLGKAEKISRDGKIGISISQPVPPNFDVFALKMGYDFCVINPIFP